MFKEDLIKLIINCSTIQNTLSKVQPEHLREDFKSHFYLQLLEKTEEKLLNEYLKCDDCLIKFAAAILKLQLKSTTSPFYKLYRQEHDLKSYKKHLETESIEDCHEKEIINKKNYYNIISVLNAMHPKKSKLFIEYWINGKSLTEISLQYNIKYRTCHKSIRATEAYIRLVLKFEGEKN